jgi:hypothetical protein
MVQPQGVLMFDRSSHARGSKVSKQVVSLIADDS